MQEEFADGFEFPSPGAVGFRVLFDFLDELIGQEEASRFPFLGRLVRSRGIDLNQSQACAKPIGGGTSGILEAVPEFGGSGLSISFLLQGFAHDGKTRGRDEAEAIDQDFLKIGIEGRGDYRRMQAGEGIGGGFLEQLLEQGLGPAVEIADLCFNGGEIDRVGGRERFDQRFGLEISAGFPE